ncbi:MAG: sugar transferase [Legionellaceae bacterium]|nr:sugar transferase [Legionellaceae bacterium]
MKRLFDVVFALIGLLLGALVLLPVMFLVWKQDKHSPFYVADRVGKDEKLFKLIKLRSMLVGADKTGVDSTSTNDARITPVGHFIRRYKLDELTQLWNVLKGEMSLVGPRPNVKRETDLYTSEEKKLLSVKPGITDVASIVFADEGEILKDQADPDLAYNQLIRPWKSRLGLFYIEHRSLSLDVRLIYLTAIAVFSRERALVAVVALLKSLGAPKDVCQVAARQSTLVPCAPPGATEVVQSR